MCVIPCFLMFDCGRGMKKINWRQGLSLDICEGHHCFSPLQMGLSFCADTLLFFRCFFVTMQHVGTFITRNVSHKGFTLTTGMKPCNWRKILWLDFHLHAPFIGALNVKASRTGLRSHCNLLCAGGAQNPTTENVCQGVVCIV